MKECGADRLGIDLSPSSLANMVEFDYIPKFDTAPQITLTLKGMCTSAASRSGSKHKHFCMQVCVASLLVHWL